MESRLGKNMAREIKVDSPAWVRDIYRRILAGGSPHDLVVTAGAHHARLEDKAEREKIAAAAAEARRRAGGRPEKLSADQVGGAQAIARQWLKTTGSRKVLIREVQRYLHEREVRASDSTVIRHVVQPVRGIRKRSRK
jgi:hypothetical protein